jgi:hypothetical protein
MAIPLQFMFSRAPSLSLLHGTNPSLRVSSSQAVISEPSVKFAVGTELVHRCCLQQSRMAWQRPSSVSVPSGTESEPFALH